ncbi:ADP-ribosylglycohydrolase family protein [Saccharopolyspora griseoalba]|uniref:ADP-ribosylglycohydrolase family protein n=1 Tax=Saccharopolyspora griseoalba TaxID=1431848 RepID=A0ABW2LJH8_9PSEU
MPDTPLVDLEQEPEPEPEPEPEAEPVPDTPLVDLEPEPVAEPAPEPPTDAAPVDPEPEEQAEEIEPEQAEEQPLPRRSPVDIEVPVVDVSGIGAPSSSDDVDSAPKRESADPRFGWESDPERAFAADADEPEPGDEDGPRVDLEPEPALASGLPAFAPEPTELSETPDEDEQGSAGTATTEAAEPGTTEPEAAETAESEVVGADATGVEPARSPGPDVAEKGLADQAFFPGRAADPGSRAAERAPAVPRGGHAVADGPGDAAPSLTERVLGCFLGGGLGDAYGSDLEFVTAEQITERFGPQGPRGLREAYGAHGAITDDTQMTLFTAEGLIRASVAARSGGDADPIPHVQLAYQRWLHTQGVEWDAAVGPFRTDHPAPDGWLVEVPGLFKTRAPGKTIFRALTRFGDGHPAGSLTERINDSKGCGGVMRAAPAALCSTDPAEAFELGARTAAITHSHPAGYHSAGALAVIVQQALLGRSLDDGVWLALQVLETWEGGEETSAVVKAAVQLAEEGVPTPQRLAEVLGGGWVGEQALAIAVCAALVGGEDAELALRVAVHHDGDSDSTGAICGNIVGALRGVGALPLDWLAELELRDVIEQMALDCVAEFGRGGFQPGQAAIEPPSDSDWAERYPVRSREPAMAAEFPQPKPAPRRLNGVARHEEHEENR